jgi:2'-5' RNA ligase
MTNRLFISLNISDEVLEKIIKVRDEIYGEENNINWEDREKMHITIKFLGDVGENTKELITNRLDEIVFKKINAEFDKFAFFKRENELKILYASIIQNDCVNLLFNKIEDECGLCGFNKEKRKFHPHITLLRLKGKEDISKLIKFHNHKIELPKFTISTFSLIKSELKPTGSEYTKIKSYNLI